MLPINRQPTLILTFLFLLLCALGSGTLRAQHPNHPLGSSPERLYQGGLDQVDRVDLMTGTLAVNIPVGPFNLFYNSNVWRYELEVVNNQVVTTAFPDREMTAGLGWHLGMGEVYSPVSWYNDTGHWLYVGPDGGRHLFFSEMHQYDGDNDNTTFYTRDGQYLRLRFANNYWVEIDFPDGTTRRFNSGTGGLGTTYRLQAAWGPHGSFASPDISVAYSEANDVETRTITDRYGRVHHIHLSTDQPWMNRKVTEVDVQSFEGQRARYYFHYDTVPVDVSCKHTNPNASSRIAVPHLKQIDMPDGTIYSMKEGSQLLYHNVCSSGIEDVPGLLQGLFLPTGGKIEWTHQEYEFPPGETNSPFNTSAGVATRSLIDADGSVVGTWNYRTTQEGFQSGNDPEVRTEVVFPTGDCRRYFFNARYVISPSQGRGWEYSLPFSTTESSDGKLLSDQVWTGSTNGACSGTKLRSTYVLYRHDRLPGTTNYPNWFWHNSNRQLAASRTVYHDDGDRYIQREMSEFDGLGHFRQTKVTSNFWSASTHTEERTAYTNFDKVAGTYPDDVVIIPTTDSWVLGNYSYKEISEPDAEGSQLNRVEYGFNADTGALECTRHLKSGTTRSAQDIVTRNVYNAEGLVSSTKRWGSDRNAVPTTGENCGNTPGQRAEEVRYVYSQGELVKSTPYLSNGQPAAFSTLDIDVDPSTGLRITSRDPGGTTIEYDYDVSGRLVQVAPQGGARTKLFYTPAMAFSTPTSVNYIGPKVTTTRYPVTGTQVLGQSIQEYDAFGRLYKESQLLPSGSWSRRTTLRNARGWVTSTSEWGAPTKTTEFLDFDPFGRPGTVQPPNGAAYNITYDFVGERRTTISSKVATPSGEVMASQVREFDGYGRLRLVSEPSGAAGAMVPTRHFYDVNGQLTRVSSGLTIVQNRTHSYDNHGFLLSRGFPEKGINGGGTVSFSDFDIRGNAHLKVDGLHQLAYTYDDLGRVKTVRDVNNNSRLVTEFGYDTAAGRGEGRLAFTRQHNWVDLPWNSGGIEDVTVEEIYLYEGLMGALSKTETHYSWGNRSFAFDHGFTYDIQGQLISQDYPACTTGLCTGSPAATAPSVSFTYTQDRLTGIPGWIDSISYGGSGVWSEIVHANGAVDTQLMDGNITRRPRRLYSVIDEDNDPMTPETVLYDSALILYDGAGNPKSVGADTYAYDKVGRLVSSTTRPYQGTAGVWHQDYAYDEFGNLTSKTTTEPGQSPQTVTFGVQSASNRLSAGTYDSAGNLVGWGGSTYGYDAADHLVQAGWMNYLYNARGERVGAFANFPTENMRFLLRDTSDHLTSEITWSVGNGFQRYDDYVWAGDRLVARRDLSGQVEHYHLDMVNSVRAVSTGGGIFDGTLDFLPFGEEVPVTSTDDTFHFAGHERMASSGLDAMHRRFYSSPLARFLSVDPVAGSSQSPQSLNRYSYGLNSPLRFVDPDGREEKEFIPQGYVRRVPSDFGLQVMREVGSFGPEARGMEQVLSSILLFSIVPQFSVSRTAMMTMAGGGALSGGISHYVGSGFDSQGVLMASVTGANRGLVLGTVTGGHFAVPGSTFGSVISILNSALNAVLSAADAQSVAMTEDGMMLVTLKTGDTVVYDQDGRLMSRGEVVNVTAAAPTEKESGDKWWKSPPLTQERADRHLNELRRGQCIVDPVLCLGTGGGGFGGNGIRHQYY